MYLFMYLPMYRISTCLAVKTHFRLFIQVWGRHTAHLLFYLLSGTNRPFNRSGRTFHVTPSPASNPIRCQWRRVIAEPRRN